MRLDLYGDEIYSREALHEIIQEELGLPDYYGGNLDGLWDILSVETEEVSINIFDEELLLDHLGDYGESLLATLEDLEAENRNIKLEIKS